MPSPSSLSISLSCCPHSHSHSHVSNTNNVVVVCRPAYEITVEDTWPEEHFQVEGQSEFALDALQAGESHVHNFTVLCETAGNNPLLTRIFLL